MSAAQDQMRRRLASVEANASADSARPFAPPETWEELDPEPPRANGNAPADSDGAARGSITIAPLDWSSFQGRDPPARTWWMKEWLSPSPTLLAGAGGIGKSTVAQTLGTALATTQSYIAGIEQPLRVLCWFCEDDSDEIWRRQLAICSHFKLELVHLEEALSIVPRIGCDNTLFSVSYGEPGFTPLLEELKQQLNDLKIDVLFLDNVAQVFGANSNDAHHVTAFVNGIQGAVRGRPFAPIFLSHPARASGSEFAGSAAWENAVRMRWYLGATLPDQQPDTDDVVDQSVVYLAKRKANYTAKDYRRLAYRNGLFIPEEPEGARFDAAYQNERVDEIVIGGLLKLRTAGVEPTDGKNSPDYLPSQLIAKGFAGGFPKRDLAASMNRLMGSGKLKRSPIGRYANRNPKNVLVVVES